MEYFSNISHFKQSHSSEQKYLQEKSAATWRGLENAFKITALGLYTFFITKITDKAFVKAE